MGINNNKWNFNIKIYTNLNNNKTKIVLFRVNLN